MQKGILSKIISKNNQPEVEKKKNLFHPFFSTMGSFRLVFVLLLSIRIKLLAAEPRNNRPVQTSILNVNVIINLQFQS